MSLKTKLLGVCAAVVSAVSLGAVYYAATAQPPEQVGDAPICSVKVTGERSSAFRLNKDQSRATTAFTVSGKKDCKVRLSATSFFAPSIDGKPYNKQTIHQRVTRIYTPGSYSLGVTVPTESTVKKGCYYQLDLTYGTYNQTPVLGYGHGEIAGCVPKPAMTIAKTVNGSETAKLHVGDRFQYEIVVTNTGNVTLKNIKVKDVAPAGVAVISSTGPGVGGVTPAGFVHTIPEIQPNKYVTLVISARITAEQPTPSINTACATTAAIEGKLCDTASTTTEPKPLSSVTIVKTVNDTEAIRVALGDTFTYKLVVTNTGQTTLKNVIVDDDAPTGVTFISTDKGIIKDNELYGSDGLAYRIASLAPAETHTIVITAKLTSAIRTASKNTACVNAPSVNPTQPTVADDCDEATIEQKRPGVKIEKTVNDQKTDEVDVNEVFTYKLVVTNTGEVDLTNVVVTDPSVSGVTLLTTDFGTITNNQLRYTIAKLAKDAQVTITLTAKVVTLQQGELVNQACVNAKEVQPNRPNRADDCDTASVTVKTPPTPKTPRVKIEKTVMGREIATVTIGTPYTYELVVTNNGETVLQNVEVTDPAPAGVTLLSTDKGVIASNVLTYTIPSLRIGESATIIVQAKVTAYTAAALVNTAYVDAPTVPASNDCNGKDDCDPASVVVTPECKPGIPVGSPRCDETTPCPVPGKEDLPASDPDCYVNCPVPGKEDLPSYSPDCKTPPAPCPIEGKEHLPKHSKDCIETPDVPETPEKPEQPKTPTDPKADDPVMPTELPATGITDITFQLIGAMSLMAASAYYLASRRIA